MNSSWKNFDQSNEFKSKGSKNVRLPKFLKSLGKISDPLKMLLGVLGITIIAAIDARYRRLTVDIDDPKSKDCSVGSLGMLTADQNNVDNTPLLPLQFSVVVPFCHNHVLRKWYSPTTSSRFPS